MYNKVMNRIGCVIVNTALVPSDKELVGTELQISISTDFNDPNNLILNTQRPDGRHIVLKTDLDPTTQEPRDILTPYTDIEVDSERLLYIRYRLLMADVNNPSLDVAALTPSDWSKIGSSSTNMRGYAISSIIITTPIVTMKESGTGIRDNVLTFSVDGFALVKGVGNHVSTTWLVTDQDGNTVYKREEDKDNKLNISLPKTLFENNSIYTVRAMFHTDTGGRSNYGDYVYNPYIATLGNLVLEPILPFTNTQDLFFRLRLLKTAVNYINVYIKEDRFDAEVEVYREERIQPKTSIKITNNGKFTEGKRYIVYCNYIDTATSTASPLRKVCEFTVEKSTVYPEVVNSNYPGLYGDLGRFTYGNAVINTVELKNGMFIMAANTASKFVLYGRYGNTLRRTNIEFDFPISAHDENLDPSTMLPYINIIPMYNDYFAINYTIYQENSYKKSIWAFYKIDLVNNKVEPVSSVKDQYLLVCSDELMSTAISSSAVVDRNNTIWYIPAEFSTDGTNLDDLPLMSIKLEQAGNSFSIVRTKEVEVIKAGIKKHMTICPKGFSSNNTQDFLIIGGTNDQKNDETSDTGAVIPGVYWYNLRNYDIMQFNSSDPAGTLAKVGSLPTGAGAVDPFPESIYNIAAYLRADGKIVLFNNSNTGPKKYDSQSYLVDVNNLNSNTSAVKENNETKIDIPFRTTVRMRNGDFIRITYTATDDNYAILYPHVPLLTYSDAEVQINKNLVIRVGETITIDNPYVYESIRIEGDGPDNTGKLRWIDNDKVRLLDWRDVIYTRPDEHTLQAEKDRPKEHLWVLDGVSTKVES